MNAIAHSFAIDLFRDAMLYECWCAYRILSGYTEHEMLERLCGGCVPAVWKCGYRDERPRVVVDIVLNPTEGPYVIRGCLEI